MSLSHYHALLFGYGVTVTGYLLALRLLPDLWPKHDPMTFQKPWQEVGWVFAAIAVVILTGQLFTAGMLLPMIPA